MTSGNTNPFKHVHAQLARAEKVAIVAGAEEAPGVTLRSTCDSAIGILRPTCLEADDSLVQLTAALLGPPDTPYSGAIFLLSLCLPPDYPFKPPLVKFLTPVVHPNINLASGRIDLDILQPNTTDNVLVSSQLEKVLLSISVLLASPNLDPTCFGRVHSHRHPFAVDGWEERAGARAAQQAPRLDTFPSERPLPRAYLRRRGHDVIFQLWVGKQLELRWQGLYDVWLSLVLPHVYHASHPSVLDQLARAAGLTNDELRTCKDALSARLKLIPP